MAEDAIDEVVRSGRVGATTECRTVHMPLVGALGYTPALFTEVAQNYTVPHRPGAIDTNVAKHLAGAVPPFGVWNPMPNETLNDSLVQKRCSPHQCSVTSGSNQHHVSVRRDRQCDNVLQLHDPCCQRFEARPVCMISAHAMPSVLAASYGDRAHLVTKIAEERKLGRRLVRGHPMLEAEVVYAANHEYCETAEDFIARRTRLAFLDVDACRHALPRVRRGRGQPQST